MCINDQIFSNIMFIVSFLFGSIWILKFIPKNVVLVWLRKPIELIQLLHLIHELGRCAIFEKSSSFRILSFLKWSQKKLFNYGLKKCKQLLQTSCVFFSEGNGVFSWQITLGVVGLKKTCIWLVLFGREILLGQICLRKSALKKKKISGISPPILSPGILSETLFEAT